MFYLLCRRIKNLIEYLRKKRKNLILLKYSKLFYILTEIKEIIRKKREKIRVTNILV